MLFHITISNSWKPMLKNVMFTTFRSICNQMEVMIKILRLCHLLVKPCSLSFNMLQLHEGRFFWAQKSTLVSVLIAYDRGHNIFSKKQICTPMATIQVSCLWNKEGPNQRVKRDKNTHSPLYYPLWEETEGHPVTDLFGKIAVRLSLCLTWVIQG